MPIKKSAKKYMRVTTRKSEKNVKVTGIIRSAIKKTREAIKAVNKDEAKKWLAVAMKALDKASEKNIVKKNTAARKKSRLNKAVKALVLAK